MTSDDTTLVTAPPTTRRAVLRTGVRLAYAAPVVAASMRLSAGSAGAQVSGPVCPGGHILLNGGCFEIANAGCGATCLGVSGAVEGSSSFLCVIGTSRLCTTSADCPAGEACAAGAVCVAPC